MSATLLSGRSEHQAGDGCRPQHQKPHTKVVGSFPDGNSALNLAAARLRHIAGTQWSAKRYLNMQLLKDT